MTFVQIRQKWPPAGICLTFPAMRASRPGKVWRRDDISENRVYQNMLDRLFIHFKFLQCHNWIYSTTFQIALWCGYSKYRFINKCIQWNSFPIRMDPTAMHDEGTLWSVHFLALRSRTEVRWCCIPMKIHKMLSCIGITALQNLRANYTEVGTLCGRLDIFMNKCSKT